MKKFITEIKLPVGNEIEAVLQDSRVKKIINFCLGPVGTNIGQAAEKWSREIGIQDKVEIIFLATPEECLQSAREVDEDGVIGIFWTCAVYFKLNELFFNNPDTFPFFINYTMDLDEMQLATRPEKLNEINNSVPEIWLIASHPSPAPLMSGWDIKLVNSNSAAALECQNKVVDACITTEAARVSTGLVKIHSFGSPPMVFFGGITYSGAQRLSQIYGIK